MIRFEVSELAQGYTLMSGSLTVRTYAGSGNTAIARNAELNTVYFVLSAEDSPGATIYEVPVGNRPIHGDKVYGQMRDKEVNHLNASGTVYLPSSTVLTGASPIMGLPTVYMIPNSQTRIASTPRYWGQALEIVRTLPTYDYTYSGKTYRVRAATGRWFTRFDGDKMIIVAECEYPEVWNVTNNTLSIAASVAGRVTMWSRRNGLIYAHGTYSISGSYYSGSQQLAYLASIPSTGGTLYPTVALTETSYGDTSELVDELSESIRRQLSRSSLHLDEHPADFSELALECSAQMKVVDQNVLLLVLDVDDWRHFSTLWKNFANSRGWKRALRSYKQLKRGGNMKDLINMFKPGSSAYLFGKYAVLPSVSDVKRLIAGVQRSSLYLKRQRIHSRRVTSLDEPTALSAQHTAVITVQCSQYPSDFLGITQRAIAGMKKWGLYPGVQNLWDMLPYSFVIDWIVQYGDLFKDVDEYLDQKYYFPVSYCVMSEKWEVSKSISSIAPGSPASGEVAFSYYTRWISREIPLPSVSLSVESTAGNHLLESSALVLQRL